MARPFTKKAPKFLGDSAAAPKTIAPPMFFTKTDAEHGIAYGWAIVSTIGDEPYFDLHGDHIPMDACIRAAAGFMKRSRSSDDQHDEVEQGFVPFCMPVYKGIINPLLGVDVNQEGLIIGAKCSAETLEKINAGERRGFSIGGGLFEAVYTDKSRTKKHGAKAAQVGMGTSSRGKELDARESMFLKSAADGTALAQNQRRIFVDFEIDFISTVDWPAQEGAVISVVKRAPGKDGIIWIAKDAHLTSEEDGHQHVIRFDQSLNSDGDGGYTSYAHGASDEDGHSHDFVVDTATGDVTIAADRGHTHTLGVKAPSRSAPSLGADTTIVAMRAETAAITKAIVERNERAALAAAGQKTITGLASKSQELKMTPEEIAALNKRVSDAEARAEMNDAEKAHVATLSKRDADSFMVMSTAARHAEIAKAVDADPVAYKCDDGTIIRKSQGELLERMARRADATEALAKKQADRADRLDLEKRVAKEAAHYPGDISGRVALLKAIDGIPDEKDRALALAAVKAGDISLAKNFRRAGKNVVDDVAGEGNPNDELDRLAKAYAKENKVSFSKAYDEVLKTPEGEDLYVATTETHGTSPEIDEMDDDEDGDFEVVVDGNAPKA